MQKAKRHNVRFVGDKAGCADCLRYASGTAQLYSLYPACIVPKKRRTRVSRILYLDYGLNERGVRLTQLWDKECKEFLLHRGDGTSICKCRQYSRSLILSGTVNFTAAATGS